MENKYASLDNFLKLCRKAQEMIFDTLEDVDNSYFFALFGVDNDLAKSTPIEQMFEIGNTLNLITKKNLYLYVSSQVEIFPNNKRYIVDFLIDGYEQWSVDTSHPIQHYLRKPLIIELDGKQYHSSTKQINYDYQRENDLKLAGYDVMRFTGSQIFNGVYDCLEKVCQYVEKADKDDANNMLIYIENRQWQKVK